MGKVGTLPVFPNVEQGVKMTQTLSEIQINIYYITYQKEKKNYKNIPYSKKFLLYTFKT